ncbi:hypothetical protein DFQ27_002678, partial [Actinomortierella ambigua]
MTKQDSEGYRIVVLGVSNKFSELSSLKFNPGNCEIDTIGGVPAEQYLQTWAEQYAVYSKDAN